MKHWTAACIAIAATFTVTAAQAQKDTPAAEKPLAQLTRAERNDRMQTAPTQTFYLKHVAQANDGNEILTGLRLILDPSVKLYLVPSQNAIIIRALPDDVALASKLIAELDRPRKAYRLTYTVTQIEAGKRVGTQHYSMIMANGQRTTLKEGSKVPIATGSYSDGSKGAAGTQTQFTYLDVGMNFDATLTDYAGGAQLLSKVEESGVGEEKMITGVQEPVIRQSVLQGTSFLTLGKPSMLGSIDVPGGTHHLDIEAMIEAIP